MLVTVDPSGFVSVTRHLVALVTLEMLQVTFNVRGTGAKVPSRTAGQEFAKNPPIPK